MADTNNPVQGQEPAGAPAPAAAAPKAEDIAAALLFDESTVTGILLLFYEDAILQFTFGR